MTCQENGKNLKSEQKYFKPGNRTKIFHSIKAGILFRCHKGSETRVTVCLK